jgi:uncharacterized alkaline shock family protein YloU
MIKLLDPIVSLVVLALGGWIVYSSLLNEELNTRMYDLMRNTPLFGAALGGFLILSVVLRLVSGAKSSDKGRFINFHSEDGSVGISTRAICDFIERIGKEFSAVKSIDSKLITSKGGVDVQLSVRVLSGNKIPELSHVLQQRVRESVRESLGLEEIRNITIKVQEIVGEPAAAAPPASDA